ncbi:hypothetical protein ACI798_14255 [Geodermatophilus sp. SYSU D01045]
MAGRTRRRRAPLGARLAVTAGVGAAAVLATPGMASAHYGSVSVTCVTPVQDGYWNVVFGYTNTTGTTATVQRGQYNDVSPDRFDGAQPTRFTPGLHPGAFSVRVPASVSSVRWQVLGTTATAGRDSGTRCPSSTPLPADGNGMGIVIALAAAGAVGGTSVVVSRRRRDRGTPEPVAG